MDPTLAPPESPTSQDSRSPPSSVEASSSPPSSPPSSIYKGNESDLESASGGSDGGEQQERVCVDKSSKGKEKAEDPIEPSPEPKSDLPSLWPTMPGNVVQLIMGHNARDRNSMALNARICKPWYIFAVENLYRHLVISNYQTLEKVVGNRYFKMRRRLPTISIDISGVVWCDKVEKLLDLSPLLVELKMDVDNVPPLLFMRKEFRDLEKLGMGGSYGKVHKSYVPQPNQVLRQLNLTELSARVYEDGHGQLAYRVLASRLRHLPAKSLDLKLSVGAYRPDLISPFEPLAASVDTLTLRTEKSLCLPQLLGSPLVQFASKVNLNVVDGRPRDLEVALPQVWSNLKELDVGLTKDDAQGWRVTFDSLSRWFKGVRPVALESVKLRGVGVDWRDSVQARRFFGVLGGAQRLYGQAITYGISEYQAPSEKQMEVEELRRIGRKTLL